MKINHGYQDPRASSAQDTAKTQETAATQTRGAHSTGTGKSAGNDEVNLSSLASAIQGALSDSPERAAYLDKLAGQYEAGTYNPDPKSIASGILSDALADGDDTKKL